MIVIEIKSYYNYYSLWDQTIVHQTNKTILFKIDLQENIHTQIPSINKVKIFNNIKKILISILLNYSINFKNKEINAKKI